MPASYSKSLEKFEKELGYSFKGRALLLEALTHRSFHHENPDKAPSYNERLEFLGDSVLGLVVVEHLFKSAERYSESTMAKIKSYLVKESILSDVASMLSLGKYLRLGKGEEETGGREKKSLLCDAIEAVFGAIYLDGGYDTARETILRLFEDKINAAISSGEFYDFKTELQEESQMRFGTLPEYRVVSQEGEAHKKVFTVDVFIAGKKFGRGRGKSKKEAQTLAAKEALEGL